LGAIKPSQITREESFSFEFHLQIVILFKILDDMIVYTFKFVKSNLNYNIGEMKKI